MAKNKKIKTAVLIGTLLFIGLGTMHFFHIFDNLEYKAYDFRVKLFADTYKPSDDIMVILLDQPSIDWANRERGWGWPWPRKAYAEIVDYMNLGGAKSVAFDVLFSEPSIYRSADQDVIIDTAVQALEDLRESITAMQFTPAGPPGGLPGGQRTSPGEDQRRTLANYMTAMAALQGLSDHADDDAFAQAGKKYGRVVQTVFFSTQTGSSETWPEDIHKPLLNLNDFNSIMGHYALTDGRLGAQFPIPSFTAAAGAL
ncbi:MAG: CHASE2 domain-containing protein, partial [Treponema sp.]|nr:CHASE2 domain-containing protein [Treponema sp.]